MAASTTEWCRVWPKTAAQDVKCVWAHCRGAGSSGHPAIFPANWFMQTSQDLQVEFLVNCLPVGSVLVVYDTLRIKKAINMTFVLLRTWHPFFGCYLSNCQSPVITNDYSNFNNHFLVSRCWRLSRAEVLRYLNWRNQSNTCVRPTASSPNACCNNWYVSVAVFPILKQNLMQMLCSVLSHIAKIAMT